MFSSSGTSTVAAAASSKRSSLLARRIVVAFFFFFFFAFSFLLLFTFYPSFVFDDYDDHTATNDDDEHYYYSRQRRDSSDGNDSLTLPLSPLASSETRVKNVARNPKMSSELSTSCGANNALNGKSAQAFHGACRHMATSRVEDDPWMTVDVASVDGDEEEETKKAIHSIYSIEIWVGLRKCNSIRFDENEPCDWMRITDEMPMVVELLFDGEEGVVGDREKEEEDVNVSPEETKKIFTDDGRLAYTWDNVQIYKNKNGKKKRSGGGSSSSSSSSSSKRNRSQEQRAVTGIKISLPGKQRQLSVQEVKIWARIEEETTKACVNDRIGDDCATDLTLDWAYLPQNFRFARENWNRTMYKSLEKSIEETQSSKCDAPRAVSTDSYNIGMGGKGAGFASTIHFLSGYLSDAHLQNKPWVFGGRLNYAYNRNCANSKQVGDVECYFEPYSACGEIKRTTFAKWKPYPAKTNRCTMPRNRCRDLAPWKRIPTSITNHYSSEAPALSSSSSTLQYNKGLFFFRSAIVAHMMRLNKKTIEELDLQRVKESIGFKHPIIGVHVRRGDACHTTGRKNRCRSFENTYLPHIRTLSEKYGVNRVFLATDDDELLRKVKNSPAANEFEFVNVDMDRSIYKASRLIERRTELYTEKSNVAHEMTLQALTDIFLLAEADAFIGHFLSNLSRLAIELSAAEKGFVPPFISVDGQWCRHWKFCR
jgi:hypothetical protein